jgi:hypothetical protein
MPGGVGGEAREGPPIPSSPEAVLWSRTRKPGFRRSFRAPGIEPDSAFDQFHPVRRLFSHILQLDR